jgi:hypothetical protein
VGVLIATGSTVKRIDVQSPGALPGTQADPHPYVGAYRISRTTGSDLTTALAGCGNSGTAGNAASSMNCSIYNTVNNNAGQYVANTNAVSALLLAHGINPGGSRHYSASAGDNVKNVTVASDEVTQYCRTNPNSTIDTGIDWSNFKK